MSRRLALIAAAVAAGVIVVRAARHRANNSQGTPASAGIGLGTTASVLRDDPPGPVPTTPDRSHLEPSILDAAELADREPFLAWRGRVAEGLSPEEVAAGG